MGVTIGITPRRARPRASFFTSEPSRNSRHPSNSLPVPPDRARGISTVRSDRLGLRLRLLWFDLEPQADRRKHLQHRRELGISFRIERSVEALSRESGFTRDLAHAAIARDLAERFLDRCRVRPGECVVERFDNLVERRTLGRRGGAGLARGFLGLLSRARWL